MRAQVMELGFDTLTMEETVAYAMEHIRARARCRVVTPNAEFGLMARRDKLFRDVLNGSQLVLPDGIGVIYASRIVGSRVPHRVAGADFAQTLCGAMAKEGMRLFLLGAKPGVAEAAAENLKNAYPGLLIAGTKDGYFRDDREAVAAVAESGADAAFICLGAPKQERFMAKYDAELTPPVLVGLGGTLDVLAGKVSRAPVFFQKAGLEWFYRLVKEPKRVGRMARLPLYLWYALLWRMGGRKDA